MNRAEVIVMKMILCSLGLGALTWIVIAIRIMVEGNPTQ